MLEMRRPERARTHCSDAPDAVSACQGNPEMASRPTARLTAEERCSGPSPGNRAGPWFPEPSPLNRWASGKAWNSKSRSRSRVEDQTHSEARRRRGMPSPARRCEAPSPWDFPKAVNELPSPAGLGIHAELLPRWSRVYRAIPLRSGPGVDMATVNLVQWAVLNFPTMSHTTPSPGVVGLSPPPAGTRMTGTGRRSLGACLHRTGFTAAGQIKPRVH